MSLGDGVAGGGIPSFEIAFESGPMVPFVIKAAVSAACPSLIGREVAV